MKYLTLTAITVIILFSSCTKEAIDDITGNSNCPAKGNIEIITNSPVIVGWPLTLSSLEYMEYLYKWEGPNGFLVNYNFHSSEADDQGKLVTTFADSGTYRLQLRDSDGCIVYEGTTRVEIIDAPTAPCNVTNNTSTSSVVGVGGSTYTSVNGNGSGDYYTIDASGGGEVLTVRFLGDAPPTPGVYKSSGGWFPFENRQVGIFVHTGIVDFVMHPDFDVYVTNVGGKTQVSFCTCSFSNPISSTPINISAKLTER